MPRGFEEEALSIVRDGTVSTTADTALRATSDVFLNALPHWCYVGDTRRRDSLFLPIEDICRDPKYGKGREAFVMLLGRYGGPSRAETLILLLEDEEVQGHALCGLRLLGVPDAASQARSFLEHPRPWIRKEARKYLDKIGETEE